MGLGESDSPELIVAVRVRAADERRMVRASPPHVPHFLGACMQSHALRSSVVGTLCGALMTTSRPDLTRTSTGNVLERP